MADTQDAPAFPWSPELLKAQDDYFAPLAELEAMDRPTFVDDYPPGMTERIAELRGAMIEATTGYTPTRPGPSTPARSAWRRRWP
jgi:hypothetical protein